MVAAGWSFAIIQSDGKYGLDKHAQARAHTHTHTCPHPERVGQINSYQSSSGEGPSLLFVPPANHLHWGKKKITISSISERLEDNILETCLWLVQCSPQEQAPLGKILPAEFPFYLQAVDTEYILFTVSLLETSLVYLQRPVYLGHPTSPSL